MRGRTIARITKADNILGRDRPGLEACLEVVRRRAGASMVGVNMVGRDSIIIIISTTIMVRDMGGLGDGVSLFGEESVEFWRLGMWLAFKEMGTF